MISYDELILQLRSLVSGVPHLTANLANASALLYNSLDRLNWAGFYILEGETLILGPFQGKPACIEIPLGKGVCGTAAESKSTILVDNVHKFPGHIACDSASNSEIVIPLFKNGEIFGVLDIDSPFFSRFTKEDKEGLEAFALYPQSTGAHRACAYLCSPGTQSLWPGGFCGSEWLPCLRDRPLFYGRGCFGVSRHHQLGKG